MPIKQGSGQKKKNGGREAKKNPGVTEGTFHKLFKLGLVDVWQIKKKRNIR